MAELCAKSAVFWSTRQAVTAAASQLIACWLERGHLFPLPISLPAGAVPADVPNDIRLQIVTPCKGRPLVRAGCMRSSMTAIGSSPYFRVMAN